MTSFNSSDQRSKLPSLLEYIGFPLHDLADFPTKSALQFRHGIFNTMLELALGVLPQLIMITYKDGNINP